MATIKLDNVAATASITIQLIKDYSMYTSEIISSNGTIFQSTDTSTTLTLRVYKGIEDITNKITDIRWSKFYFDNDELKEDYEWGLDKNNKSKITLYKDDIEEKSIIQASGYSNIEGTRELVTTARITMIKISDVYISDITPVNPSDNMMWMDTNNDPPILKLWDSELKVWKTSGADIPVVKNVIRNSNFWTDIDEYYELENSNQINTPTIITDYAKRWLTLQSKNSNSQSGGITQDIQYPISSNANYIFSFIAYKEAGYSGNVTVRIDSIDSNNRITSIVNQVEQINTSITSIDISFKTLNSTENLRIYVGTETRANSYFHITELSLFNSSVYYPWEPCPEDTDKQVNNKLDNDRLSVFNTLTENGNYRAIYESNGQYYIRGLYIIPEVAKKEDFDNLTTKVTTLENYDLNTKLTELQAKYDELQTKHNELQTKYDTDIASLDERLKALENQNSETETPSPETPNS